MSTSKRSSPSTAIHLLTAFGFGVAAAAGCGAALAALMASQGLGPAMVWSFSTATVSAGSLLGGWLVAFLQKSRGLVWGGGLGLAFALALLLLQAANGSIPDSMQIIRLGLVVFFGAAGGYFGVLGAEKQKRHHN